MRLKIKEWAFKKALSKPSPTMIPMSGIESEKNDFYSVIITLANNELANATELDQHVVMLEKKNPETGAFDVEDIIDLADIDLNSLSITHYYKNYYTTYQGINAFIFHCLSKKDYLKINTLKFGNWLAQKSYNKTDLKLSSRYELLEYLLENYGYTNKSFDLLSLLSEMHSLRFYGHPDRDKYKNQLQMHLDSFVASGEIMFTGDKYHVVGKSIVSIEKFVIEERRHRLNTKLQCVLAILTFVLSICAIVQAGLVKLNPFWDFTL